MATLSKKEILDYLNPERVLSQRLVVTPIVDRENQIGNVSIDLRLANQFIIFKSENIDSFTPLKSMEYELLRFQEHKIIPFGDKLVLHPGSLMLGATYEYIKIPLDLEAQVEGRSSWARLGLVIAAASTIDPGFVGSITLELCNLAKTPIVLTPGCRICQIVFHQITSDVIDYPSTRKYKTPIGPEFSKIFDDSDFEILKKLSNH